MTQQIYFLSIEKFMWLWTKLSNYFAENILCVEFQASAAFKEIVIQLTSSRILHK